MSKIKHNDDDDDITHSYQLLKRQNAFPSSLSSKVIRRSATSLPPADEIAARRQAAILARFRNGLAGQKLSKYVLAGDEVDVQLGEDLTETLRGLKASFNNREL
ncbi:hypothetical protein K435DRAFT_868894 [Dendrothele bispora CBS 962.96]|uniref:Ribosome biogenesis protein NOP53 n=1 Tax=Dendrothele bispora (strain CBS 962.96) TaxID=1314807 RepID=A0A4S8LB14_DENBC|nr:hypothetical protein K435DRAFT_870158 [Dendrothele bispora CBS 962.96]THU85821.1 hypothetical protein K435DRAFT_868894 [Dendrothele bispora CBS 962.96]